MAENGYYLVSAGAWAAYDQDYLIKAVEDFCSTGKSVSVSDVTSKYGVFALAGPKTRDVLGSLICDADPASAFSNKRFPRLSAQNIELGMCPVTAIRVAYTGELGGSSVCQFQNYLWDQLCKLESPIVSSLHFKAQNATAREKLPCLWNRAWS